MSRELEEALEAFGARSPRFLSESENAVYAVERGKDKAALRLHRRGYQGAAEIRSELWWTDALVQRGLAAPRPLGTRDGARLITLSTGRLASMVSWVAGTPLDDTSATPGTFYRAGAMLARLHNVTDALKLPAGFSRHAWDVDGLMGETPFWGRFWENPTLSAAERTLIEQARNSARKRLAAFRANGGDFGLIHADPIRSNLLVQDGGVTLIDFDDCGFGFRLYDLAVLMTQNQDLPDADALQGAAVAGYRSLRPLPDEALEALPLLIMARRLASMGWTVSRLQPGNPGRRASAVRALAAAERFLTA